MAGEPIQSNLSGLAAQVAVEQALVASGIAVDAGLGLDGKDNTQTVSSNSDEHVIVYSTLDGEPHEILRLDARRALTKRLANGRPAFWIPEMGGPAPARTSGSIPCYLDPDFDESDRPDHINREWIDSIGLRGRFCNGSAPDKNNAHFVSDYDRDAHMAMKHRREWATINTALGRQREAMYRAGDKDMREAMMALAQSVAGRNEPTPASAPAKAAKPAAE